MSAQLMMVVFAVLLSVAVVWSLPASQDETLFGPALEVQGAQDTFNPQDPQAFIRWRQIKKLLFLG